MTLGGALVVKSGLHPWAPSPLGAATGIPRSPLFGAKKYTQPMRRLELQTPIPLVNDNWQASFPLELEEPNAKRLSWHTDFSASTPPDPRYVNQRSGRGPIEGRPPGEFFAHQRWQEFFPEVGYILSMADLQSGTSFHPRFPTQAANKVWTFGQGRSARGAPTPPLIKARYGEPLLARIYNNLPLDRADNGDFGRNEISTHFHNAHNGAESDGACNAFHFPGTFYDYRWSTTLARRDRVNTGMTEPRASGPDGHGGLTHVAGDFRELQGSMWFHDHRFFFTAENVYKGNLGVINYYSGPDRGNERLADGVNHRLPSGYALDWGNIDFDVNLVIHDASFDKDGQYTFDIFDMLGHLGDCMMVNFAYCPYFEVLPRKYRFRLLNAGMSRFIKLAIVTTDKKKVPFTFIANDGNLLVNPIPSTALGGELPIQSPAERYDIVIDFGAFPAGARLQLVNLLLHKTGEKADGPVSISNALKGEDKDPAVGGLLEFRVVSKVDSVDAPGLVLKAADADNSYIPPTLTEQIPIVTPVRTRHILFKKDELNRAEDCLPSCEDKEFLPWVVRINGEDQHSLNANRVSLLVPKPGEVEHWTIENGGGGWDHPIHLHFEEGVTFKRNGNTPPVHENLVRKDVWRLPGDGKVTFQVQFGEFGGAYVQHCHNTVHEDFAMLLRYQILADNGEAQLAVSPTPIPTEDGVTFKTPEILPEGDPRKRSS
ncbi:MAG: multicopper oxidase family protein [Hyphomicrobium sp.]|uniref:multicopper oxidase family protein n=1 Tax=Hyphomicrobium sp. TaxID=82 RepID=UPI003D1144B8